jgi:NADH-quinone oxidoreductase subunit D
MTVLFYGLREREVIMDLFEAMVGQRLLQNAYPVGGVRLDFPQGWETICRDFLAEFPRRIDEYEELLSANRIWLQRTKGVGVISGEDAVALGLTGPTLRGSGVYFDVRKAMPYSSYGDFDFEVPLGQNGDVYDRYLVRVREMRQSVRIVQQALDGMPEGDLMPPKLSKILRPPAGEAYFSVEGAKGQLGYYVVSDGTDKPWRLHVRSPSFVNLQGLEKMCVGGLVADVVANIGSLDIVLGEVDR